MDLEIRHEEGPSRGRYVVALDQAGNEAELTYQRVSAGRVIADHTGVPRSYRGRGIAQALVARLVADAKREGFQVVARCPFVKSEIERRPDWHDIVAIA